MIGNEIVGENLLAPTCIRPVGTLNVWRVIEAVKKLNDNDVQQVRLSIQDIPEDRYDEAMDLMCEYFIAEEAVCKSIKMNEDKNAVNEWRMLWNYMLKQGISVGAFVLDSANSVGELIGLNVLYASNEEFKNQLGSLILNFKTYKMKDYMKFTYGVLEKAKACSRIDEKENYIGGAGLAIKHSFRGQKLGVHLLNARNDIGKKYGITMTSTVFTGPASQNQAERAGFTTTFSENYAEIVDTNGQARFPNIEAKVVKVMIKDLI